jgi:hypothetical protein
MAFPGVNSEIMEVSNRSPRIVACSGRDNLGGLLSWALVYGLAPETEGHGTGTVVKALHWTGGTIRAGVAPVKVPASAIAIGSGGSAGREAPTALIAVTGKIIERLRQISTITSTKGFGRCGNGERKRSAWTSMVVTDK